MAAGQGYKNFITGDVLTAGDVNGYLMQGLWVFANATARDAAVTSPQEGNACYLKDTDVIQVYSGSAWATQSASNPISANIVDAKGDLIAGTAADTVARLAVGANDTVLTADSSTATGLKWAAPAGGVSNAIFRDEKTSGTNGGTFTSGAWRTRDINATQVNTIAGASIASNQITLPAGTFYVEVSAPAFAVDQNQARLQNITDSTTTITGQNAYFASSTVAGIAIVTGQFTIASSKTFEIQHQSNTTRASDGFGAQNGFGTQVYTTISISKVG